MTNQKELPQEGFLAVVCRKYYKEAFVDDCYYLQILRWFRDHLMTPEDKEEYYRTSPVIVAKINAMETSEEMYRIIFTSVVQKCADLIEDGKCDEAYKVYKACLYDVEALAYNEARKRVYRSTKKASINC